MRINYIYLNKNNRILWLSPVTQLTKHILYTNFANMAPLLISLPQMVDMALATPETGCINLTVLHSLLHILVRHGQFEAHRVEFRGTTATDLEAIVATIPNQSPVAIAEFSISDGDAEQPDKRSRVLTASKPADVTTVLTIDAMPAFGTALDTSMAPAGFPLRPMQIVSGNDLRALQSRVTSIHDRLNAVMPDDSALVATSEPQSLNHMVQMLNTSKRVDAVEIGLRRLAEMTSALAKGRRLPDDYENEAESAKDSMDPNRSEILELETRYASNHSNKTARSTASTGKSKKRNSFKESASQHCVPATCPALNPQLAARKGKSKTKVTGKPSEVNMLNSEDIEFMLNEHNERLLADAEQITTILVQTTSAHAKITELTQKLLAACADTLNLTKCLSDLQRQVAIRDKANEAELKQITDHARADALRLDNAEVTFTALIEHGVQFAEEALLQQQELFLNTMIEVQQQLDAKVDRYSIPALKQWIVDQMTVFAEALDGFRRLYGMIPDAAGALMIHNVQCISCQRTAMQRDREAPPATPATPVTPLTARSKRDTPVPDCRPMPTIAVIMAQTDYELSEGTDGRMYRTRNGGCRTCCVGHDKEW